MLDMDRLIYVWHGILSNFSEKAKGMAIANIINNHERAGMAKIVMLDKGGTKVSCQSILRIFLTNPIY